MTDTTEPGRQTPGATPTAHAARRETIRPWRPVTGGRALAAASVAAALLTVTSAGPWPDGGRPAGAQPIGGVLFTDDAGGAPGLFLIDPDTGARSPLAHAPGVHHARGDWSPQRTHVAYSVRDEGLWRIAVLDLATGAGRLVTTGPEDHGPDWSPDGERILFTAHFNRGTPDQASFLMVIDADGMDARPVVALVDPQRHIAGPRWSPDGTLIAFAVAGPASGADLYVVERDGTNARRLLVHAGWDDVDPAWSPDGSLVAFASGRAEDGQPVRHDIWLLDAARGVAGTVIVDEAYDHRRPSWSPDGRRLVFDRRELHRPGAHHLAVAPVRGGAAVLLTTGSEPDWAGADGPPRTPVPAPSGTATPADTPTHSATEAPPPVTELPPLPTLPPFPTIPGLEPTASGPPPTFPPAGDTPSPSATATPARTLLLPAALRRAALAARVP